MEAFSKCSVVNKQRVSFIMKYCIMLVSSQN